MVDESIGEHEGQDQTLVGQAAESSVARMDHILDDPQPLGYDTTDEEKSQYKVLLSAYAIKWCSAYEVLLTPRPEIVWCDFVNDFSCAGIQNLESNEKISVREVLLKKKIQVSTGR